MIFRDVQLIDTVLDKDQSRYLMSDWENVRDIFCTFLPKKFDFNRISKLNIYRGPFEGEDFKEALGDGIASFHRSDFEFGSFAELSESKKNELSLFYV